MSDFPLPREAEQRLLLDAIHQALQRRAGLGVATRARGALAHLECAKAN